VSLPPLSWKNAEELAFCQQTIVIQCQLRDDGALNYGHNRMIECQEITSWLIMEWKKTIIISNACHTNGEDKRKSYPSDQTLGTIQKT